jgi:mono/diheme cytochrome c family protein
MITGFFARLGMLVLATAGCASNQGHAPAVEPSSKTEKNAPAHVHETTSLAEPPTSQPTEGAPVPNEVSEQPSDEQVAYERARPVFEQYCASCHTTAGRQAKTATLKHFSMDSYPFGGHHAGQITATIRQVLGATGKRPTMPRDRPGVVKGKELALILSWADAVERRQAQDHDEE